jgi:D-alanine-D-alanine ligase
MGGPDAEREVSLLSGSEVAAALRASGQFNVVDQTIDRPTVFELKSIVSQCGAEVIFPVLHGHWGEGGPLQELLEQLGLPYVGSQPRAARLAMDKLQTKLLVGHEGVRTPAAQELQPNTVCTIKPPLVIKPVDDGSSVDLRICRSEAEVVAAREHLHPCRSRLMAEAYVEGRELTVGILLDQPLPLIEIIPAVQFYDYEAKYTRDDTQYVIGPELPPGINDRCVHMAMAAYRTLGCRDVARIDIMFDGVKPWFLEINTMPGFTTHSLVPMAARKRGAHSRKGWEMPELCARLAHAALERANGLQKTRDSARFVQAHSTR